MKHRIDNKAGRRGFTLTELLVVIAIITILASITIPNLIGYIERGRVARTVTDVKNAETSLSGMLADAGVNSFQDFLSPAARFVLEYYDDPVTPMPDPHPLTGLDPERHRELLYRTMFYLLLRVGRDAALPENIEDDGDPANDSWGLRELFTGMPPIDDGAGTDLNVAFGDPFYFGPDDDPDQEDPVFNRAVVNKLRTSYMVLGTDSWGNPLHFWMGPLPRGEVGEPMPLRSFRLNETDPTANYVWDLAARNAEQQKVAGQPPVDDADGYPAPNDLPFYVWSNGSNGEQDAHLGLRTSTDVGFSGGGDDINSWDNQGGWNNAPRPTS